MKYPCVIMVLALASACSTGGGGELTGDSESETETGEDSMDGHGTVRIVPMPLDGDASVFDGTTSVHATVHYGSCLQEFYFDNPEFQQLGPEGAPVFDAWFYKLCADFESSPLCLLGEIEQWLIPASSIYNLQVSYAIAAGTSLAGSEFHIGPLPTSELAGCEARVELLQTGLVGRDTDGTIIWRIATLPANNTAVTDQSAPLQVEIMPVP